MKTGIEHPDNLVVPYCLEYSEPWNVDSSLVINRPRAVPTSVVKISRIDRLLDE